MTKAEHDYIMTAIRYLRPAKESQQLPKDLYGNLLIALNALEILAKHAQLEQPNDN